jgi:predicted lipid-binding transport protein (Tim44 family)
MADQLQREIEEILNKLDEFIPEQKATSHLRKQWSERLHAFGGWLGGLVSRVSMGHLMIASLVLVFIAFAFRSSAIGQYSMIAGLSLLGLTIVVSFLANRRTRSEKRWRGQVVALSGPGPLDRLQDWFRKRRSRTR